MFIFSPAIYMILHATYLKIVMMRQHKAYRAIHSTDVCRNLYLSMHGYGVFDKHALRMKCRAEKDKGVFFSWVCKMILEDGEFVVWGEIEINLFSGLGQRIF